MVVTLEDDDSISKNKVETPKYKGNIQNDARTCKEIEESQTTTEIKTEDNKDLENILCEFKLYHLYHIRFILMIGLLAFTSSMYCTNYIFVAEDTEYRCKQSQCENRGLLSLELNSTLNFKCKIYNLIDNSSECSVDNLDLSNVKDCNEWVYENKDSFVAQFNLGCEDWKRTLVGTMHSLGYMIGLLLVGPLSDKFGRKSIAIFSAIAVSAAGVTKSLLTSYWLYIILELIEPLIGESYSPCYTLAVESVSKSNRPKIIVILGIFSTLGSLSKTVIAWLSPNWRMFLISIYGPSLLFIVYIVTLPESPRWLLNKGEAQKAMKILRKAAETDNIVFDDRMTSLKIEEHYLDSNLLNLLKATFKSRKLFLRLIGCICLWITTLFSSYTLSINSVTLKGNKYLNYELVALSEFPAAAILYFSVTKLKRKLPIILSLACTAIFCGAQPFVSEEYQWLSILLYASGKMSTSIAVRIVYLYTSELFPTYTRNTMHALCSSMGRIGVLIAPQTPLLLKYWAGFPSLLVGIMSSLTVLVVLFMPETSQDVLPDNVWEAEALGD